MLATSGVGSENSTIKIWNYKNGNELNIFQGHKDRIVSLCRLEHDLFASGSRDKTIKIWNFNLPATKIIQLFLS